jgi:hypothetical protein
MYDYLPDPDTDPETWTLEECSEYVALAWESHGEMSAEAGMGAMSLGYGTEGAYEAASAVPQPADDPKFVVANRRLEASLAAQAPPVTPVSHDDIPF